MARIFLAPEVLADFDRFVDHIAATDPSSAAKPIAQLVEGIQLLASNPLIGHPARGGKRELVMGRGAKGYIVLYRFVPLTDSVVVLAARNQREDGYKHG